MKGAAMKTLEIDSEQYTLLDFLDSEMPDPFAKAEPFYAYIQDLKQKGMYSYHRVIASACANRTLVLDPQTGLERQMVVMASNSYLGLNTRPEPVEAARQALVQYGTGQCGSRFLSGTYDRVVELERQLAEFEGFEDAMVLTTGYQANLSAISALMRPKDVVFMDRLSHASIVDGCRVAGCAFRTFRHNDVGSLARVLERYHKKYQSKLIVAEGVFSMDGDMAPLPAIVELAQQYGARVMVDEAHATGVIGPNGRGAVEHFGLKGKVDIVVSTFSKTLGATGGFIASSKEVINYMRHYGRSYMFSASPTPSTVAAVLKSLQIMCREPQLRTKLWENVRYFSNGLKQLGFGVYPTPPVSAILTVSVGPDVTVHAMSKDLHEAGVLLSSVVYPAVSPNEGRLRLSLSAAHTRDDLDTVLSVLGVVGEKYGIIGEESHAFAPNSAFATG
jgi:glycine C-acetyltransferase